MGVWTLRASAASFSVIVHSDILIISYYYKIISFIKGATGLSDKEASLLCGIYTLLIKEGGLESVQFSDE